MCTHMQQHPESPQISQIYCDTDKVAEDHQSGLSATELVPLAGKYCQAPSTPAAGLCPTCQECLPGATHTLHALASPAHPAGKGGEQDRDGCQHSPPQGQESAPALLTNLTEPARTQCQGPGWQPQSKAISRKATESIPPGPRVLTAPSTCGQLLLLLPQHQPFKAISNSKLQNIVPVG